MRHLLLNRLAQTTNTNLNWAQISCGLLLMAVIAEFTTTLYTDGDRDRFERAKKKLRDMRSQLLPLALPVDRVNEAIEMLDQRIFSIEDDLPRLVVVLGLQIDDMQEAIEALLEVTASEAPTPDTQR